MNSCWLAEVSQLIAKAQEKGVKNVVIISLFNILATLFILIVNITSQELTNKFSWLAEVSQPKVPTQEVVQLIAKEKDKSVQEKGVK